MKTNIRYKLTTQDLTTYNDTKWVLNEQKKTSGEGQLCNSGWLHCYTSPLLAILLNPIHANITNPKLFKCEVEGKCLEDNGLKEGWTMMRIIEEIEIPQLTPVNKAAFGILCALEVYKDKKWIKWANNWLNGKDRSKESASAARYADAAAHAANAESAYAARYAAAAAASNAAADDYYAYRAAYYAAVASYANINLIKIAERCLEYK